MHSRYCAGFLTYSRSSFLYALLICSASLARKFRAAAVLAFSALRILSCESSRVRERASTHPTDSLRTFRSTVRPERERETYVGIPTYEHEGRAISLNATSSSTKHEKVRVYEVGLARPYKFYATINLLHSPPRFTLETSTTD